MTHSRLKNRIALLGWLFLPALGLAQSADSLLARVDGFQVPYEEFLSRTRITTYQDGAVDEDAVFDAYISGPEKSLVIQKEGRNREMKILYHEEKLWVSLPGSRRPLRITPIQRLMGQASNGDVARVGFRNDYTVQATRPDTVAGEVCRVLRLKAKKASSTYASIDLWVRAVDNRPVKADFYLTSGKLLKRAKYDRYELYQGRPLLKGMTLFDEIRKNEKTVFIYEKIEPRSIPAHYYNKNYLVHVRDL